MITILDIPLILSEEMLFVLRKTMSEQEIKQLAFNAADNAVFNKYYELKNITTDEKSESEAS